MTEYLVPAPISEDLTKEVQQNALRCFKALGLEVYGRIDYRLNEKDQFFCLEANTLPGMTDTSLVPKSVKAEGKTFEDLINDILLSSMRRY
jgi:D-alanine-D-alanine ligase